MDPPVRQLQPGVSHGFSNFAEMSRFCSKTIQIIISLKGGTVRQLPREPRVPEPQQPRPIAQESTRGLELQSGPRELQQRRTQQQGLRFPAEESSDEPRSSRRRQLIENLEHDVRCMTFVLTNSDQFPLGGRLRFFVDFWRKLTPSKEVISIILGAKIPFISEPFQSRAPFPCVFNEAEKCEVQKMVTELLNMDAIVPVEPEPGQFVSQIFLVTNKDLSKRAILNVKCINEKFLPRKHFKMETLQAILPLIRRFDWFGSWDLRKGYFNVAVHPDHQRFFCFDFEGQRYMFKCLVMGLSLAPLFFSRIMSVLVQVARSWGIRVSVYLDDSLTRGPSFHETLRDHQCFGNLLQLAGFLLHKNKSVQVPVQRIEHLGFILDSRSMMLEVPQAKETKIRLAVKQLIRDFQTRKRVSIRRVARVIGLLVSIIPAVKYGKLHYRSLERAKIAALAGSGNFERRCRWPKWCLEDLKWWRDSPSGWACSFESRVPSVAVITDASLEGWGAICDESVIFGPWESDFEERIDELELLAILYAVQCWADDWECGSTVQLWCDNQVAVAYVKNMGGRVDRLDRIAKQIWSELECRDLFMIPSYVNTRENPADALTRGITSKKHLLDCEVQLNPSVFEWLTSVGPFRPEVDWFATNLNAQLPRFYAWKSDPAAEGIDAFDFSWSDVCGYIFPPFILIPRIVRKVIEDKAWILLVHPDWPGALWAPDLRRLERYSVKLPSSADLLRYPDQPNLRHPMRDLRLVASWLDGAYLT